MINPMVAAGIEQDNAYGFADEIRPVGDFYFNNSIQVSRVIACPTECSVGEALLYGLGLTKDEIPASRL
jgi:hypothetical protein